MATARKRRKRFDYWTSPRDTNRELFIRDPDSPLKIKVRADETVIVDVKDLYRVIRHTGEIDEETGLERIEIVDELVTLKDAQRTTQCRNERVFKWRKAWLEILNYNEVFKRENGELIDNVRPRKTGPTA